MSSGQSGSRVGNPGSVPNKMRSYREKGTIYEPRGPGASTGDNGQNPAFSYDDGGGDEPLIYSNVDELELDFKDWKIREEEDRAAKETEIATIQEEAIKTWKEEQMYKAENRRQEIEGVRSSLRAELTKQRIVPKQVEDIVNSVHPHQQVEGGLDLLQQTLASDKASSMASGDSPAKTQSSRRRSIWSRK